MTRLETSNPRVRRPPISDSKRFHSSDEAGLAAVGWMADVTRQQWMFEPGERVVNRFANGQDAFRGKNFHDLVQNLTAEFCFFPCGLAVPAGMAGYVWMEREDVLESGHGRAL